MLTVDQELNFLLILMLMWIPCAFCSCFVFVTSALKISESFPLIFMQICNFCRLITRHLKYKKFKNSDAQWKLGTVKIRLSPRGLICQK